MKKTASRAKRKTAKRKVAKPRPDASLSIKSLREQVARRDFRPFDDLDLSPARHDELLTQRADDILRCGWTMAGFSIESIKPPIDWAAHNRSFSYHLHAWEPCRLLLHAHSATGDQRYIRASYDFAQDWIDRFSGRHNLRSHAAYADDHKVSEQAFAWYDMAVGRRIYRLAYILECLLRSPNAGRLPLRPLWDSLCSHHKLLARESFIKKHSNHGIYQVLGQLAAARRFDFLPAMAEWRDLSEHRLAELINLHFFPSGVHNEHSPGYHYMLLTSLVGAAYSGVITDPVLKERIRGLEEALSWMIKPDLHLATIGDTDPRFLRFGPAYAARHLHPALVWQLGGTGDNTPPPTGVRAYPDAGYAFARLHPGGNKARSYSKDAYLATTAGFHSRVHKHADHLSFIWYDKGRDIFIDPGRYGYAGRTDKDSELFKQGFWYSDPKRIYCESTRAHNTVEIDGKSFPRTRVKPFGSALLQADEQNGLAVTFCAATHFRRIRHQRQVIMGPGRFLLVLDWLYDRTGEPHDYRQFFHFDHRWNVRRDGNGILAENPGRPGGKGHNAQTVALRGATLIDGCQLSDVVRGQSEPEMLGWLSDRPNRLVPTDCFHVHAGSDGPTSLATLFVFGDQLAIDKKKTRFNTTMSAGVVAWEDNLGKCEIKISRNEGKVSARSATAPQHARKSRPTRLPQEFEQLRQEASHIPSSTGHAHFAKYPLRLGIIADVYMYNYYKDVCRDVVYLTPGNCREQDYASFDLILYTTCWKGINDEEWRGVKFRERPKLALDHIISETKRLSIPTAFQSIEDPSNFDYFLPIAQLFDHIFTTDTDCISRYAEALGHNRVHFGEYGFNPAVNNPIGSRRNIRNSAFFAGSYATRYPERCTDMATIFNSILQSGGNLVIADRNYGTTAQDLTYPEPYRRCLVPAVEHELLQKVHKLFRYNLNFNSITQSPSMCAMRTYELQAMGCGIISNYARSVYNLFPNLRIIPTYCDLAESFAPAQSWEEFESICRNIRRVFAANASFTVFGKMLRAIGLSTIEAAREPSVAVFCDKMTPRIAECFEKQTHQKRRLIERTSRQGAAPKLGNFTHFCWFSDQETYEPHYLEDMLNVFKFTDASYVTKHSYFDHNGSHHAGPEHEFTDTCAGKQRSLFRTDVHPVKQLWSALAEQPFALRNGYATDPFSLNFDQHLRARSPQQSSYQLSLIVPVHNNGAFLEGKCFPSILRNKQWAQFEVILVDDASSAPDTKTALQTLEARYGNVKVLRYAAGPSGSASVPRNLGMAAASAPLLTFLDPDNEISPGGYDTLLDLFRTTDQKTPLLSAYNVKVGSATTILARRTKENLVTVPTPKFSYLESGKFPVVATQAAVISAAFLRDHDITFVEGSAGQDTLFGWELLANAPSIAFTGSAFLIYYADRIGSITNVPDKAYFRKKLILEVAQQKFLTTHGLFPIYRQGHFLEFMRAWYFKLLERAPQKQRTACLKILKEIASLYGATIRGKSSHLELHLEGADSTPNHHE